MVFMPRFPHSGHISMIDDADENLQVVVDFLSRVHEAHEKQQAFVPKDWDETVPIGLANRDGWRSDFKLSTGVALMIVAISSFAAGMLLGRSKARADEYVRMLWRWRGKKVASRNAATCSKQSVVLGFKNGSSVILGGHSILSCLGIRFLFQQSYKEVVTLVPELLAVCPRWISSHNPLL